MAASISPVRYDPKVLFQGALSTTLTTTLVTAPSSERGVRITTWVACVTGSTARSLTFDYFKSSTGRKLLNAVQFPADGMPIDILGLLGGSFTLDTGDLIRGGQDSGTDVDVVIAGIEMEDA